MPRRGWPTTDCGQGLSRGSCRRTQSEALTPAPLRRRAAPSQCRRAVQAERLAVQLAVASEHRRDSGAAAPGSFCSGTHLVPAERLLADGDPTAGLETMNEMRALHEERDVVLVDDVDQGPGDVRCVGPPVGRTARPQGAAFSAASQARRRCRTRCAPPASRSDASRASHGPGAAGTAAHATGRVASA